MRIIDSAQVERNFISYIEDHEPFAIAHHKRVAGCYIPTNLEMPLDGHTVYFDDHGIFYQIYPKLKEDELLAILEDIRYRVFE